MECGVDPLSLPIMTVVMPFTYDHYRAILSTGLENGFQFCSFSDVDRMRRSSAKACFLRHDCDNDLTAACDVAHIEREFDVRSTYFIMLRSALYNALAPTSASLIERILSCGHLIGLHFDESVFAATDESSLREQIDFERDILRREFGQAVDVVSFHQPGKRILENEVKISCLNTYDRHDMREIYYTSDSNLRFRGGDPRDLFQSGKHRLIQILTHPEWWTAATMPLKAKWARMLRNNVNVMQSSLLEREAAFSEEIDIVFRDDSCQ